jgi:hypothetical protein
MLGKSIHLCVLHHGDWDAHLRGDLHDNGTEMMRQFRWTWHFFNFICAFHSLPLLMRAWVETDIFSYAYFLMLSSPLPMCVSVKSDICETWYRTIY